MTNAALLAVKESLRIAIESDLGALWIWPESAKETWMKDARAALSAIEAAQGDSDELDAAKILAAHEVREARRADAMPTERDAIRVMFAAHQRLKELGWRDGRSMPTTGERFAGIQSGSTGIHAMTAEKNEGPFGQLTSRTIWTTYDGDIWPSSVPPVLYREWRETDVQPNLRPTYLGLMNESPEVK